MTAASSPHPTATAVAAAEPLSRALSEWAAVSAAPTGLHLAGE